MVLQIERNGNDITVIHETRPQTYPLKLFKKIVSVLLEYYREGSTDISPQVRDLASTTEDFSQSPRGFERAGGLELWGHRQELYEFAETEKLFPIKWTSFQQELISAVGKEDILQIQRDLGEWYIFGRDLMLSKSDAELASILERVKSTARSGVFGGSYLRDGTMVLYRGCQTLKVHLCDRLEEYLKAKHGITDPRFKHRDCPLAKWCLTLGGTSEPVTITWRKLVREIFAAYSDGNLPKVRELGTRLYWMPRGKTQLLKIWGLKSTDGTEVI